MDADAAGVVVAGDAELPAADTPRLLGAGPGDDVHHVVAAVLGREQQMVVADPDGLSSRHERGAVAVERRGEDSRPAARDLGDGDLRMARPLASRSERVRDAPAVR